MDVGYCQICRTLWEFHVDYRKYTHHGIIVIVVSLCIIDIRSISDTRYIHISISLSLFILMIFILLPRFDINFKHQFLIQFQSQTIFLLKLIPKQLNLIQPNLPIIKSNRNKITFTCKLNTFYLQTLIITFVQYLISFVVADYYLIIACWCCEEMEMEV